MSSPAPMTEAVTAARDMHAVQFRDVSVSFIDPHGRRHDAVEHASLNVPAGSFVSLIGPSGCGKTTLLRLVAGLESAVSGEVRCEDTVVTGINRHVGYISQDSNLYPWLSVAKNVAFPLTARGVPRARVHSEVADILELVGLARYADHYPHQLSGGMQKRVAIARTLVYEPGIILMDEPFGALDALTRMALQSSLQEMWLRRHPTIIFVTHDLVEAVALSDVVVLMSRSPGRIKHVFEVNLDRPRDIYNAQNIPGFGAVYDQIWRQLKEDVLPGAVAT